MRQATTDRQPLPVALAFPAVALASYAVTVALGLATPGGPWADSGQSGFGSGLGTGLSGLLFGVLAAIVLRRGAYARFGWVLAASAVFWSLDAVAEAYVRLGYLLDRPLPAMTLAVWFLLRFTAILLPLVVVLPLLFPTGRMLPGRWRVAGWSTIAVGAAWTLLFVLGPSDAGMSTPVPPGADPDPTTLDALAPVVGPATGVLRVLLVVTCLVPLATVLVRYRRSAGVERDRMRWLVWGVLAAAMLIGALLVVDLGPLEPAVLFLTVAVVPVAMTVAVVNPSLVSIQDLLGRTVLYGGLWTALLTVDAAALALLTRALGDTLDQRQVVLTVVLLAVLLYVPLRDRLRAVVRRLLLGERDNPYGTVAGLATSLETAEEGAEQLAAVARSVATAFGAPFVSVEVDRPAGEVLTATYGTRPAQTRVLPITYRDQPVGRLVLPARGLRWLSHSDEQLLGDLVRQAATAARTSSLADELQQSRERLVVAREEERRRIRRDLHDGLGPALSGVVFGLESARLLVDRDPEAVKAHLATTRDQVQEVVADVRRLVHDLRPPALDDRGLVGALRQLAESLRPLDVEVDADDLADLPAAVEVAAYRIASEAMTNVVRYAEATRCTVRLVREPLVLLVEVSDDGAGIPDDAQAGVGMMSMRERAAELGGRSEVTCPPDGGTVVRAWLPVPSPRAEEKR
ncbi:sensor histidine kinase [Nocardioides baculatus]|uniref:histidine kinase n=1 Tax=Nocardioides baculatus TaxID=2801337 RepID=A0ABS1L653_9ACTN|nr:sensor histidine kinase [Nocardioides baculatus]MBL0747151.1 sensor histidine kinase [Nocardioides baculatus]